MYQKSGEFGAYEWASFHYYMQKFSSLEIVHKKLPLPFNISA